MTHRLVDWLYGEAIPLWLAHGLDRQRRGFHESLDPGDLVCRADFRRLYITARQIYVFSEAERRGLAGAREVVTLGLDFLACHARQADDGYAWRFDLANRVTDATCDLYDLAFVLFAFSKAGRPELCHRPALRLMAFIDKVLEDGSGGWREADPPRLPRRQNPHMHLLEAVLAAYEAFGEPVFITTAHRIVTLALERFIGPEGDLAEYYDAHLGVVTDPAGRYITEPGHHFEWAWLLKWYKRNAAPDRASTARIDAAAKSLIGFANRHGISRQFNAAMDEIHSDGTIRLGSAKLWPQTERLKAVLAWPQYAPDLDAAIAGLAAYIDPMRAGRWQEQRDADGEFIPQPMQAGSLYHITCALLELDKVSG